jgi:hypothetical protein
MGGIFIVFFEISSFIGPCLQSILTSRGRPSDAKRKNVDRRYKAKEKGKGRGRHVKKSLRFGQRVVLLVLVRPRFDSSGK